MMAATAYVSSAAALPLLRSGSLLWSPSLSVKGALLAEEAGRVAPETLFAAVDREGRRRLDAFLAGIEGYRNHPYMRALPPPPAIWRSGSTAVFDYGGSGEAVVVVPSLVNRAYILDLSEKVSLMRWLAGRGVHPYLIDWGRPGAAEQGFTLTDYVRERLGGALDAIRQRTDGSVTVAGYCMGGLLALALAQLRPAHVRRLVLLATPWDFHAERAAQARAMQSVVLGLDPVMATAGLLDVEILQALFASLDPFLSVRKFAAFSARDPASDDAHHFVAVEDWANDGVPLTAPVARECLGGWYGANTPASGSWMVGGVAVRPETLGVPVLIVIPARDRIVPPASAAALSAIVPNAVTIHAGAGHIGMVAGRQASATIWPLLASWLTSAAAG